MVADANPDRVRPDGGARSFRALRWPNFLKPVRRGLASLGTRRNVEPDAPHRHPQPRRADRAGRRHPLPEPVPRRADRHARAEPAGAGPDHRRRYRRAGDASTPTRSRIDPDKLLELQAGQSGSPYRFGEGAADFPIDPERVAPLLRRLISPTRTRARIYDYGRHADPRFARPLHRAASIQSFDLPPLGEAKGVLERWWDALRLWYRRGELPVYEEIGSANGREYQRGRHRR